MNFISVAMAQDAAAAAAPSNPFMNFLPLVFMLVIFYFILIRPQQKQQKLRKVLLANLKRGDEVVTNGGLYGKITEITDTVVMLQVANNVVLKLDRSQVNVVLNPVVTNSLK